MTQAAPFVDDISPFVGLSVGNYKVFFEPGYGKKIFRKDAVFYNICAGTKFNNHVGLEIGHQHDNKRKNLIDSNHYPGGPEFHPRVKDAAYFKTHLNIKHTYLGLTFHNHLTDKIEVSFLAGVSLSTVSASHTIYSLLSIKKLSPDMILTRNYKKHKLVTMTSSRIQYRVSENLSLRVSLAHFRLSRISVNSKENGRERGQSFPVAPNTRIKIRSPINYSIGVCVNL